MLGWYACQPEVKALYAASPEVTFRFTADSKTRVTVTETSETAVDFFAIKDTGEGCAGSALSCISGHPKTLVWEAEKDESFFIVLDSRDGTEASVDLEVTCCTPTCEGRVCGSDGCGGTCGECEEEAVCDGGQCVDPSGLSCNPSVSLTCGQSLVAETFLSDATTSSVDYLSCTDEVMTGPERAYSLIVEDGGLVSVSLTSEGEEIAGVFLLEAGDAACAADACLTGGESEIAYLAKPNSEYTLVVEGNEGANSTYDLSVNCCSPSCDGVECGDDGCGGSCGTCVGNSVCAEGSCKPMPEPMCNVLSEITCGGTPLDVQLGGVGSSNSTFASPCVEGDLSGPETGFSFVASEDAKVLFSVASDEFPGGVALTLLTDEGQGCDGNACVMGGVGSIEPEVSAGESYYLVVDGLDGAEGMLTLSASCCTPTCDGKSCGDDGCGGSCGSCASDNLCADNQCVPMPEPTCTAEISVTCGQTVSGELDVKPNQQSLIYGYSCNPFDYSGMEVAYKVTSAKDAKVQVALTPGPDSGELDIFLIGDDDGMCHSGNCQTWGDSSLTFSAKADEVNYLLVDGFMGDGGSYELSVECCNPACEGKSCGVDDGCGGICGCPQGEVCFDGMCSEPASGDSCGNPWLIQALPYTKTSSTKGPFGDAANTAGGCDSVFGVGEGVTDVVYQFVPEESGSYLITLESVENDSSPSVLYVLQDCQSPMTTCLGYSDEQAMGVTTLQVDLKLEQVVFIVVDGLVPDDTGAFSFSMEGPL